MIYVCVGGMQQIAAGCWVLPAQEMLWLIYKLLLLIFPGSDRSPEMLNNVRAALNRVSGLTLILILVMSQIGVLKSSLAAPPSLSILDLPNPPPLDQTSEQQIAQYVVSRYGNADLKDKELYNEARVLAREIAEILHQSNFQQTSAIYPFDPLQASLQVRLRIFSLLYLLNKTAEDEIRSIKAHSYIVNPAFVHILTGVVLAGGGSVLGGGFWLLSQTVYGKFFSLIIGLIYAGIGIIADHYRFEFAMNGGFSRMKALEASPRTIWHFFRVMNTFTQELKVSEVDAPSVYRVDHLPSLLTWMIQLQTKYSSRKARVLDACNMLLQKSQERLRIDLYAAPQ